ncbi:LacI family DNA-binding transcriptional regulator [Manganibacter manganicus]|uniref:HTH lacI-type domain-containing protein n=1 Tax=Manganibacter manganicus TaxID=1873176 RepID=A0A1V8RLJ6_9HYPH|nr:LacI family DNA-binding transcriptional regulator [Pseudaminobacter manganicus]OQM74072.1 hypothetical protein BFN67_22920 [Pseudaminobacter manganicus]
MSTQPRIKDVAARAGVAVGTVSRVLNNQGNVSEEARRKVLKAIEELNYQPNAWARNLRTGRSRNIGYCVRDISNPLFSTAAVAIERVLDAEGLSLLIRNSFDHPERELKIVRSFLEQDVDGLILSPSIDSGAHIVEMAAARGVPVAVLDRESPAPSVRVMTDHVTGVEQATKYLLDLGHRDIAIITGSQNVSAGRARVAGYERAFEARHIPVNRNLVFHGSFSREYGEKAGTALLRRDNRPTAIITGGTPLLLGLLPVINSCALSIPDDLSIICCDDIDITQLYRPPITVVRRDIARVGRLAAEAIVALLSGHSELAGAVHNIPTELVVRESCAPPGEVRPPIERQQL